MNRPVNVVDREEFYRKAIEYINTLCNEEERGVIVIQDLKDHLKIEMEIDSAGFYVTNTKNGFTLLVREPEVVGTEESFMLECAVFLYEMGYMDEILLDNMFGDEAKYKYAETKEIIIDVLIKYGYQIVRGYDRKSEDGDRVYSLMKA